jgi:hypothetical protein
VEKKAWATKEAANRLSISTRSPIFFNFSQTHTTKQKIGTKSQSFFFLFQKNRSKFLKCWHNLKWISNNWTI